MPDARRDYKNTGDSLENYDIGPLLGRGGFAKVFQAFDRVAKTDVAIKFISKRKIVDDKSIRERVCNEIQIHLQLKHPSIVNVLNHFEDKDNVYIVLELCVKGNLFKYMNRGRLEEKIAAKYCFQLLQALQYLQSSQVQVIHRDLKLSNILLDENLNLKLCDFGLATQLQHPDEEQYTILGTPNYIAPEVVSQTAHGYPADLWSLGCLLFAMLTGETPFEQRGQGGGEEVRETLQRVVDGQYNMPADISQTAQNFLRSLLQLDPSSRPTVAQAMQHPFVQLHANNLPITTRPRHNSKSGKSAEKNSQEFFPSPSQAVHREMDRHPNESFAATTLVSYDGRTLATTTTVADATPKGGDNSTKNKRDDSKEKIPLTNRNSNYEDDNDELGDDSTCDSELFPQSLRLLPEKQYSFEIPHSSTQPQQYYQHHHHLQCEYENDHRRGFTAAPVMVTPPPLSYSPRALSSRNEEQFHSHIPSGSYSQDVEADTSMLQRRKQQQCHQQQFQNCHQQLPTRAQLHIHRMSYPPPSPNQHQTTSSQHLHHGHILLNHLNSPEGRGHSLALSLDSSLHCSSLPSSAYSVACSGALTSNSSMSSTDFFEFSRRNYSNSSLRQSVINSHAHTSARRSHSQTPDGRSDSDSRGKSRDGSNLHASAFTVRATTTATTISTAGTSGRRLWVRPRPISRRGNATAGVDAASSQAFCYCSPRGDVLLVSKGGDVVYLTYLRDKSNHLRPCRLSVRAEKPLTLLLGKVTKQMCREIKDIIASSQKGGAFSLPGDDNVDGNSNHCSSGDGVGEDGVGVGVGEGDAERGKALLDRRCRGGFIGKEALPTQALDILSDTLWVSSYHITRLPFGLKKTYATVARMLEAVKCKLPKLILYLTEKEDPGYSQHNQIEENEMQTQTEADGPFREEKAVCKCMIMCNDPLPDFSVRWSDGTKLRYSLSDGKLHITNNQGKKESQYSWAGVASTDADWTTSAPEAIRKYLLQAQSAMRRCIAEDMKHQSKLESGHFNESSSSCGGNRRVLTKNQQYPIIVVESIDDT